MSEKLLFKRYGMRPQFSSEISYEEESAALRYSLSVPKATKEFSFEGTSVFHPDKSEKWQQLIEVLDETGAWQWEVEDGIVFDASTCQLEICDGDKRLFLSGVPAKFTATPEEWNRVESAILGLDPELEEQFQARSGEWLWGSESRVDALAPLCWR